ncbi:hypothetical protein P3T40_001978 [Paraburkholderia sp. EB58]|uniref:hypothetical protein n=1 Tax=Paraburkholderia sp. EB58 TaxID=3035125 RepID=UPI003D24B4C5
MKSIELNAEARRAWLRREQGLPPESHTGNDPSQQSDFEKSRVWRAVFVFAALVIIGSLLAPEPGTRTPGVIYHLGTV